MGCRLSDGSGSAAMSDLRAGSKTGVRSAGGLHGWAGQQDWQDSSAKG